MPNIAVAILYEDWETGLRAKVTCDQVEQAVRPAALFSLALWRFDLLEEQIVREQVALAASDANILVVSAHGHRALPNALVLWLEQWLIQKSNEPAALVISLDLSAKDSAAANEILAALAELGESAGLDLFFHFGHTPRVSGEAAVKNLLPPPPSRSTSARQPPGQD